MRESIIKRLIELHPNDAYVLTVVRMSVNIKLLV
jgi:hypothetical protein